jgi:hypothetical protein
MNSRAEVVTVSGADLLRIANTNQYTTCYIDARWCRKVSIIDRITLLQNAKARNISLMYYLSIDDEPEVI